MLTLQSLRITYQKKQLVAIDFTLHNSLALIGESGSGKSLTLKALLQMLPQQMDVVMEIDADFPLIAGKTVGFVPQNPFTALSPLSKIKKQFFASQKRIEALFEEVGLDIALLERFPPELSGGQLQRVVLAMALEFHPKLLLLDEPTTALDPQTKKDILTLLKDLASKEQFKMLFVTHDINAAKEVCEDICVLYKGEIVESGTMQEVFANPQQAYTKRLIEANFAHRNFRE